MTDKYNPSRSPLGKDAQTIWHAGVEAVAANECVRRFVKVDWEGVRFGNQFVSHADYRKIVAVGAGKSAGAMAEGLEAALGGNLPGNKSFCGWVNVPNDRQIALKHIRVVGCRPLGANLPTCEVLKATDGLIDCLHHANPDDLVIGLFSGGGSALLERPLPNVSLADLRRVTERLHQRGASISELNAVRGQLSAIKQGGLRKWLHGDRAVVLLISDVLGDCVDTIASGPLRICDRTKGKVQAIETVKRYFARSDDDALRSWLLGHLDSRFALEEKVANGSSYPIEHYVLANNEKAVAAATSTALEMGYETLAETEYSAEDVDTSAKRMIRQLQMGLKKSLRTRRKGCFISGGEPTIVLPEHPGRGGRNQHLALTTLRMLLDEPVFGAKVSFLFAGTDGEDGNEPVAGAAFDSVVMDRILLQNDPGRISDILLRADSHSFWVEQGCLFHANSTDTNVCDLRVCTWDVDP
jgi:glycerate 2-kinase